MKYVIEPFISFDDAGLNASVYPHANRPGAAFHLYDFIPGSGKCSPANGGQGWDDRSGLSELELDAMFTCASSSTYGLTPNQFTDSARYEQERRGIYHHNHQAMIATTREDGDCDQDDLVYLVDLPIVGWLLDNCLELDGTWNNGALYSAMISYTMSRPDAIQNREQVARDYFNKAIIASSDKDCGIHVRFAESVCIKNQNRNEFTDNLNFVLKFDLESAKELRLTNAMAQSRAKWLMKRIDDLFY